MTDQVTVSRALLHWAIEALRWLLPNTKDDTHGGYDARDVRDLRQTESALRAALDKEDATHIATANSATVIALLDRLEAAEKCEAQWLKLCELVDEGHASVTFYGRVNTINTGLEVSTAGELVDEIDVAMKDEQQ